MTLKCVGYLSKKDVTNAKQTTASSLTDFVL